MGAALPRRRLALRRGSHTSAGEAPVRNGGRDRVIKTVVSLSVSLAQCVVALRCNLFEQRARGFILLRWGVREGS